MLLCALCNLHILDIEMCALFVHIVNCLCVLYLVYSYQVKGQTICASTTEHHPELSEE